MAEKSPSELSDVFVSYRRSDVEFAKRLVADLENERKEVWIDWDDIPPASESFNADIRRGVEGADAFICILTPAYFESDICIINELGYAVELQKKIIPIVLQKFDFTLVENLSNKLPEPIAKQAIDKLANTNWIFFTPHAGHNNLYDDSCPKVLQALNKDFEHARYHKELGIDVMQWSQNGKKPAYLLSGEKLETAEDWLLTNAHKDPLPTDLQREFVNASRKKATSDSRTRSGVLGFIILMLSIGVIYLAYPILREAKAKWDAYGELVEIPAGEMVFTHYTNELPLGHIMPDLPSRLVPAFSIHKYEVTNWQYRQCVDYGTCTVPLEQADYRDSAKDKYPVVFVTLFQASNYCQWLGLALPTEIQWEQAARGSEGREWPWPPSNAAPEEIANMPPYGLPRTTEVLELAESFSEAATQDTNVYNMVGNVWEWTSSYYTLSEVDGAENWDGSVESFRGTASYATRGGGFEDGVEHIASRNPDQGTTVRPDLGFRCIDNSP